MPAVPTGAAGDFVGARHCHTWPISWHLSLLNASGLLKHRVHCSKFGRCIDEREDDTTKIEEQAA